MNIEQDESFSLTYVSSTEYYFGDEGEVAVELYDYENTWINASCYATAYYKDKSKFFENQTMIVNTDSQVYYYNFIVPEDTGVYEYRVDCYWNTLHASRSKSWHVSNATTQILDETAYNLQNAKTAILAEIDAIPDYNINFTNIITQINNIPDYTTTLNSITNKIDTTQEKVNETINTQIEHTDELEELQYKVDILLENFELLAADLTINFEAINCLQGSNWFMNVTVQDSFSRYLNNTDVSCTVDTDLWGSEIMNWNNDSFIYDHVCGYTGQTINWVVDCERI